ncbi:hypothetical protein C8Q77DRAFT_751534 [Trametes polyzona]|nr:hypothetical protein C8Q77DRAFT_751534 [Trametes polyzona]
MKARGMPTRAFACRIPTSHDRRDYHPHKGHRIHETLIARSTFKTKESEILWWAGVGIIATVAIAVLVHYYRQVRGTSRGSFIAKLRGLTSRSWRYAQALGAERERYPAAAMVLTGNNQPTIHSLANTPTTLTLPSQGGDANVPFPIDSRSGVNSPEQHVEYQGTPTPTPTVSTRSSHSEFSDRDESGYTSDVTMSTVPPSYRTHRPSIPNLADYPLPASLPARPLPPVPGQLHSPHFAYNQTARPDLHTATDSDPIPDRASQWRGPRRPRRPGRKPRKSIDGGVRLAGGTSDGELLPGYDVPEGSGPTVPLR